MALEGTLNYLDIAHLMQVVGTAHKTGVLDLRWQDRQARLFFENGGLLRAESNRGHDAIGSLLVDAGVLSTAQLEAALATQSDEQGRRRLGAILCDELQLRPEDFQRTLRKQFEDIVFDVFSWPGGTFVFQFTSAEALEERFAINPTEFILDVGVQAGLLAEEAMGRELADPARTPLALLLADSILAEAGAEAWRRMGHRVMVCQREEELVGFVAEEGSGGLHPAIVLDLDGRPGSAARNPSGIEVLGSLRERFPQVPILALSVTADLESEARDQGVSGFVKVPVSWESGAADRSAQLEMFLLRLTKAVHKAVSEPRGRSAPAA